MFRRGARAVHKRTAWVGIALSGTLYKLNGQPIVVFETDQGELWIADPSSVTIIPEKKEEQNVGTKNESPSASPAEQ